MENKGASELRMLAETALKNKLTKAHKEADEIYAQCKLEAMNGKYSMTYYKKISADAVAILEKDFLIKVKSNFYRNETDYTLSWE